ncbi:hypothetical protein VKT23_004357 [Stygiomarasmius scandens]|uniref:Uncharacterized protein n=1 Tax=Marasmiellus scandens TaxID=2682957 RepID=A0ABR1JX21_9AGAR
MHQKGYEKRYGEGVASVYQPGKRQADMLNDVNRDIRLEVEQMVAMDRCLLGLPEVVTDLGDTQYGLGTLGRRYVDRTYRMGSGARDFSTRRTYCPGPSLVELRGIHALTDGVLGELLRIRHGLTNYGANLTVRQEDIRSGPSGEYPPYPSYTLASYPSYSIDGRNKTVPLRSSSAASAKSEERTIAPSSAFVGHTRGSTHGDKFGLDTTECDRFSLGRGRGEGPTVTVKFFIQDNSAPIEISLPLQDGRLKLGTHKVVLGEAGVEKMGRWKVWKRDRKGGAWKQITWDVSVRGKRGDLFLFKRDDVKDPKDLDLHVEFL